MSASLIETGITIAARVLLASFEALAQKAKADEAAELTRMLGETKARLAAMPPIAESLDAIRDVHLARVRAAEIARAAEWAEIRRAERLATLPDTASRAFVSPDFEGPAVLPTEGEDPDQ